MDWLILLLESDDRSRIHKVHFARGEIYANNHCVCLRSSTYATLIDYVVIVCSTLHNEVKFWIFPGLWKETIQSRTSDHSSDAGQNTVLKREMKASFGHYFKYWSELRMRDVFIVSQLSWTGDPHWLEVGAVSSHRWTSPSVPNLNPRSRTTSQAGTKEVSVLRMHWR